MMMPLSQGYADGDSGDLTEDTLRKEMLGLDEALSNSDADQRKGLMDEIEDVLGAIDDRVAILNGRLEDNWEEADRLARVQAQTAIAALRREKARLQEWYQRMQDSSDATWGSMRDGFNDTYEDLPEAWQEAEDKVRRTLEGG
jgi:hypothetical protein